MTGMTPERLRAIEDRLPGEVFPNSVEHDVLNLLDEVRRLRAENGNLRAGAKSFVRQLDRLANGVKALHRPEPFHDDPGATFCAHCQRTAGVWPCATAALLNPTEGENR